MSEKLSVILGDDQLQELKQVLSQSVNEGVSSVVRQAVANGDRFIKKEQACKAAGGISRHTLNKWITEGGLPVYIVGGNTLISSNELEFFIRHNGKMK